MCAIAGFYSPNKMIPTHFIEDFLNVMRHRGPDDEGYVAVSAEIFKSYRGKETIKSLESLPEIGELVNANLLLAHRRLSIIDLTADGHQPLVEKSGDYIISFNGEIYNYLELRQELTNLGIEFQTKTDTEVIIKSWIVWGHNCFSKFNGMWAIAIWNNITKKLTLSRDRFGVKPLYITKSDGCIYFASEIKSLLSLKNIKFEPNKNTIKKYLNSCFINTDSSTFWDSIEEVLPGVILEIDNKGIIKTKNYFNLEVNENKYNLKSANEQFKKLFESSLHLRMRSDVEVGSLLSGGLDSTTIVAGLNEIKKLDFERFKTFSAVFDEEEFSEEQYIKQTNEKYNLDGIFIKPDVNFLKSDMEKLFFHIEEPFRSLSLYSQYKIYQVIKDKTNVKVVLNGQGADELFAGYTSHYYYYFKDLLKLSKFKKAKAEIKKFKENRNLSWMHVFYKLLKIIITDFRTDFEQFLVFNVKKSPLREYLKYDDRTSMSSSIEARNPFLDFRLVEFAFQLEKDCKINNFQNKIIVRNYARGKAATSIVERLDKMGFISPQEIWQKNELKYWFDEVFERFKYHTTYFSGMKAYEFYGKYKCGVHNKWDKVWRYFCLMIWLEIFNLV